LKLVFTIAPQSAAKRKVSYERNNARLDCG
jgi:hypothetical protein